MPKLPILPGKAGHHSQSVSWLATLGQEAHWDLSREGKQALILDGEQQGIRAARDTVGAALGDTGSHRATEQPPSCQHYNHRIPSPL